MLVVIYLTFIEKEQEEKNKLLQKIEIARIEKERNEAIKRRNRQSMLESRKSVFTLGNTKVDIVSDITPKISSNVTPILSTNVSPNKQSDSIKPLLKGIGNVLNINIDKSSKYIEKQQPPAQDEDNKNHSNTLGNDSIAQLMNTIKRDKTFTSNLKNIIDENDEIEHDHLEETKDHAYLRNMVDSKYFN